MPYLQACPSRDFQEPRGAENRIRMPLILVQRSIDGESMSNAANELLRKWLFQRINAANQVWLDNQVSMLANDDGCQALYVAFALVPRRLGKGALELSEADLSAADQCIEGWTPDDWSLADAGRVLLLSNLPGKNPDFAPRFRSLCQTADVAEAISLYRGLPLYPEPKALEPEVGEGLRTNMLSVFEAIAHHNPYPRKFFGIHRWNHMVLKAIFVGCRLAPIQGLDVRANEELARILRDFAHERWAAGRKVPYEIWRCVGPFAHGAVLEDLERVMSSGAHNELQAAALALSVSPDPAAAELLNRLPEIAADIASGRLTWSVLQ